jgi:hypothetical protein
MDRVGGSVAFDFGRSQGLRCDPVGEVVDDADGGVA